MIGYLILLFATGVVVFVMLFLTQLPMVPKSSVFSMSMSALMLFIAWGLDLLRLIFT